MSVTGEYDPIAAMDQRLDKVAAALAEAHAYDNQVLAEELEVRYGGLLAERCRLGPLLGSP